ncbi:hypothetical protein EHQ53_12880 [Leptospira langatensis]|uniref:Uncharacterized protein n=1 Tax=Leptospira langatensis TaxID=2484983 RepID=A0A5F1ZQJ4_9LEPT|nr:hypothetical protein [Leptospira langatensis]TGK02726.1 hypothetical protein EHO57_05230 [Leptospira langatensis]TGL40070.1 hypothetical protein EHQ53_12880 [Leptospira langatensis]
MSFALKEFKSIQSFYQSLDHKENSWALVYLLLRFLSSGEGAIQAVQKAWLQGLPEDLSEEKKKEASEKVLELADLILDSLRAWRDLADEEGSEAVMEDVLELGQTVLMETREMGEFSSLIKEESLDIISDLCTACGVEIPKAGYKKIDLSKFDDSEIAEEVEEWTIALSSFEKAEEASDLEDGFLVLFVKIFLFYIFFK